MTYEQLIETMSTLVGNPKIYQKGLSLIYMLPEKNHRQMNETLFYKSNPLTTPLPPLSDEYEVEVDGVVVKFVKEVPQINLQVTE